MSAAGASLLDAWIAGDAQPASPKAAALRDRLVRAGLVHPVPPSSAPVPSVGFVVPVYSDPDGLDRLLGALRHDHPLSEIVVVDDASPDSEAISSVTGQHQVQLMRHDVNRGPAAARNTGWHSLMSGGDVSCPDVVVFADADVVPRPGALGPMLAHFTQAGVAAVAPRVRAETGPGALASYERDNSPLDMGADAALVFPGTRLSYVPSAMLAVRSEALQAAQGFDEALRYGEDVDLVWRLVHDQQLVRFEPKAVAEHRNRTSLSTFARQRFTYGSSAASLAARHGDAVAPLQVPVLTALSALAMLFGRRLGRVVGLAVAAGSVVSLARKLDGKVDSHHQEALRLVATSHGYAVQGLAAAATRSWAPLLLLSPRSRRALAGALAVPAIIDWVRDHPPHNPLTHLALRTLDHGAYCAGVWSGVVRSRSIAALLPRMRFRTSSRQS